MRVLQVGAEVYPLIKTGGLADVLGALPQALCNQGADLRLLLPGLPGIIDAVLHAKKVCQIGPVFGAASVTLLRAQMPYTQVPAYVIDAPFLYRRGGGPYQDRHGAEWADNLQRFGLLGWVAAQLAQGQLDPDWQAEVVHAHDWHAAMSCAYLHAHPAGEAASVFTVHNLAFQGLFPHDDWALLGLSSRYMSPSALEFHGQLSFMKAGLYYADHITTVSPTYAQEIQTPEQGCGLDGLLRSRAHDLSGILNAVDEAVWNPATDAAIPVPFEAKKTAGKARCKAALQQELGLAGKPDAPLFGVVSRLTEQKGLYLVLALLDELIARGGQLVVLGAGEAALEDAFLARAAAHPQAVAVRIGYDEAHAHRIFAATDVTLVPSRFEPCGLTQMYGLKYGSLPLVHRVGGLADTVVDCALENLADGSANGFVFDAFNPEAMARAMRRAWALYERKSEWRSVRQRAMQQPLGWDKAAAQYAALYRRLLA